ncbi:MAG: YfcE family phosphodiesterase [Gammaproteobacteria bacterium]
MRIGVVSDTHNHLANIQTIVELFNQSDVNWVVHTGDIASPKALHAFAALNKPLLGVWGNNDLEDGKPLAGLEQAAQELSFAFSMAPLVLNRCGRRILIVHDPRDFESMPPQDYDVALHGHTHRYRMEHVSEGKIIFNPGECAGHMPGLNAIGVLDLIRLETDLLRF